MTFSFVTFSLLSFNELHVKWHLAWWLYHWTPSWTYLSVLTHVRHLCTFPTSTLYQIPSPFWLHLILCISFFNFQSFSSAVVPFNVPGKNFLKINFWNFQHASIPCKHKVKAYIQNISLIFFTFAFIFLKLSFGLHIHISSLYQIIKAIQILKLFPIVP